MVACIVFIGHELFVVRLSLSVKRTPTNFSLDQSKLLETFQTEDYFWKITTLNEILQTVERRAEKVENNI